MIVADADPRLLPVADGPPLAADTDLVGEWIVTVLTTIAGHLPTDQHPRDFTAAGYHGNPGTLT